MDRIEAKMDLRRQYFSRSASHGVENSIPQPPTQACTSQLISSMVESKQHNSRMAESAREIRDSCARILKLLQEEIAESESGEVSLSDAIEFSPSATQIEAASTNNDDVDDDSLDLSASNVVLAEEIDASESLMMALYVSEDSLPSTNLMDTNSVAHQNAALLFLPKQIEVPRYTKRNPITAVFTDCNVVEDSSIISNYIAEVIEKSVYDHPVAKYPVSPPPPKPPDRSVQSMTMGFHSKWNHTMPRPPPHPPDANHRADDSIISFSCLERAVCTPPVWKNVSVNAHGDILALLCNCIMLRNLVGSKNIQRFMVEEGLVSMFIKIFKSNSDAVQVHYILCIHNMVSRTILKGCDFVNQPLHSVIIGDVSIQELAMNVTLKFSETSKEHKISMYQNSHYKSSILNLCLGIHGNFGGLSWHGAITPTEVLNLRFIIVIRQSFNHIVNMSQNASQSFNSGDSRLMGVEWLSAKLHEVAILIALFSSFTSSISVPKIQLVKEANELSMIFALVGSVYNAFVLGKCLAYGINEAFIWVHTMVEYGIDSVVVCYHIFLDFPSDKGIMNLFMVELHINLYHKSIDATGNDLSVNPSLAKAVVVVLFWMRLWQMASGLTKWFGNAIVPIFFFNAQTCVVFIVGGYVNGYVEVNWFGTLSNAPIDGVPYSSLFSNSENLHSPPISFLCCIAKNAYGSKNLLGVRSNSNLRSTTSLVHESGLKLQTLVNFSMHFLTHLLMSGLGTYQDTNGSVCMQLLPQCFTSNMAFLISTAGFFFHIKRSLEFKLWDPGGCFIVHVEVATIILHHYLDSNLEDKVDFNGGSNVMIQI